MTTYRLKIPNNIWFPILRRNVHIPERQKEIQHDPAAFYRYRIQFLNSIGVISDLLSMIDDNSSIIQFSSLETMTEFQLTYL